MRHIFLSIFMLTACVVHAEIEMITLEWDNIACQDSCASLMERELSKISDITNVTVSQQNGMATMQWKAKKKFSFPTIDSAIKKVGLHIKALRVKVRGTISESNKKFYIHSLGDETKFNLLGSATDNVTKNRQVLQQSRYNRPLTEDQKDILREAMEQKQIVIIEGPIYQPYQFPPLDIVVGSIKIAKSKDARDK